MLPPWRLCCSSVLLAVAGLIHGPPSAWADSPATTATSSVVSPQIGKSTSAGADVTFRYQPAKPVQSVVLAGSMNGWSKDADPLTLGSSGVWELTKHLENDTYLYKFVVDGDWKSDPANPLGENDGYSGKNSILRVGPGANLAASTAVRADSKIDRDGILHDEKSIDYINATGSGEIIFKLRTRAHDIIRAAVISPASSGASTTETPLLLEFSDDRFDWWSGRLAVDKTPAQLDYTFNIGDAGASLRYGSDGLTTGTPKPFHWSAADARLFTTPDWAREAVWYQIMPERFRNGNKKNDPPGSLPWKQSWSKLSAAEKASLYPAIYDRRYGGDLQGVTEKLAYLKQLGVTAIFLNPVFQADSLHKYDATDYRHIDDSFGVAGDYAKISAKENLLDAKTWKFSGSDKVFLDLIAKAHAAGFRVIIDGVFNHVGKSHPAFQDVVKRGKESPFQEWFNITDWNKPWPLEKTPFTYEGWAGFGGLPVFKENAKGYTSPQVWSHINEVTRRWMDPNGDGNPADGVDGWRLDVPNEVSSAFWREWRKTVKTVNPNAVIIGEIWEPPARWLKGDQFDAVMNYEFCAKPLLKFWTNKLKPSELRTWYNRYVHTVPDQSVAVMMNMLDSHDTDRWFSMVENPNREYDKGNRLADGDGKTYKTTRPTAASFSAGLGGVTMQFCWPGSPNIWYGTEVGMWGPDDPDNRKPMVWKDLGAYEDTDAKVDDVVIAHYQRLAAIRRTYPALRRGTMEVLQADDTKGIFVFRRVLGSQSVVVVANQSSKEQDVSIVSKAPMMEVLNDPAVKLVGGTLSPPVPLTVSVGKAVKPLPIANGGVSVKVPALGCAILVN